MARGMVRGSGYGDLDVDEYQDEDEDMAASVGVCI